MRRGLIRWGGWGKEAGEGRVGKFRAKDVEGGLHLGIHQGFRKRRSEHRSFFGPAEQRLGQRPYQIGILLGRLNLNTHKTSCRRAAAVRAGRLALGFASHMSLSGRREVSGYITGDQTVSKRNLGKPVRARQQAELVPTTPMTRPSQGIQSYRQELQ